MKLLFVTRKIDPVDSRAGFVSSWVKEFASKTETLSILTWHASMHEHLPANVTLVSAEVDTQGKIRGVFHFLKHAWRLVRDGDGVLIHQMPLYAILIGPFARFWRRPQLLWYTHKAVNEYLRVAVFFSTAIITASPESFRLKTKKPVYPVGHGVDTNFFSPEKFSPVTHQNILSVGRISPVKRHEVLITALGILLSRGDRIEGSFVGEPATPADRAYRTFLVETVKKYGLSDHIEFKGGVAHASTRDFYRKATLVINLSETGSIDKTVLEAMACGTLVLTSNEAFEGILTGELAPLFLTEPSPERLAVRITELLHLPDDMSFRMRHALRTYVVKNHDIRSLVRAAVRIMETYV